MLRLFAMLFALVLALGPLAPAGAAEDDRLIIEPSGDTIIRIEGLYPKRPNVCPAKQPRPLLAKYRGRLELRAREGSIQIINALSFSHYLRGIAEVPTSWPIEALRAQVIAARSYALATMRAQAGSARARGYDICATDQCQVYRGATIELGAFGERWVDAVESTKGRVMTHNGGVITAFYFSTSTGRTRRAFPGGSPQPYLDSVDAMDDDAPLARWTATVPLSDLRAILRADGEWSGGAIESVRPRGDDIVVSGSGARATFSKSGLRSSLNSEGSCLFPGRYPSPTGSQTGGRLPLTVPGSTYDLTQEGNKIVLRGRGWGHDVGMSQYGARSLAERGWDAERILDHYYNHDRISRVQEPAPIRVLAATGLRRVRISIEGSARVTTGTGSTLSAGDEFEVRSPGGALRVFRGIGPELRSVTTVTPTIERIEATADADAVEIAFEASRAVRAQVEVAGPGGVVSVTEQRSVESGENTIEVTLVNEDGAPLEPGDYTATIVADDGLDTLRSSPVAIVIAAEEPPPAPSPDLPLGSPSSRSPLMAIAALAVFAAGAGWFAYGRVRANRK